MSTTPSQSFDGSSDAWIDYAAETREAMDAMYEVKESGAATREGLQICREAIEVVPSGYTAWHLYFKILLELEKRDPEGEVLVKGLLESMPKNYQLWNFYRQMYKSGQREAAEELKDAAVALKADGKNYHAWVHRQAVLENESMLGDSDCWEKELAFVDHELERDVFNNSAWTQRAFVIRHLNASHHAAEVDQTMMRLKSVPHCTTAWNYLSIVLWTYAPDKVHAVVNFCLDVLKGNRACLPCLEFLADVYFTVACQSASETLRERSLASAHKIWRQCCDIDPIRRRYWTARLHHSPSDS